MKTPKTLAAALLVWGTLALPRAAGAQPAPTPEAKGTDAKSAAKPAPSPAQVKEASSHFERGVKLYGEGDYAGSLVEFKRAYEIAPSYKVLFNLGQAAFELKDYVSAQNAFEQYLSEGGEKIDAARKKKVNQYLSDLKTRVAHVRVKLTADGAEVQVDDAPVGKSPISDPLVVNVGRRKITVVKEGFQPVVKTIDLAGGDSTEIEIVLVPKETEPPAAPTPAPAPAPAPVQPAPPAARSLPPGPFIALGITGATGISAAIVGGLALAAKSDYDDEVAKFPGNPTTIAEAGDKTHTLAIATDVLVGVTAAGGAVTLLLFVTQLGQEPAAPKVGVGPGGAFVSGTF